MGGFLYGYRPPPPIIKLLQQVSKVAHPVVPSLGEDGEKLLRNASKLLRSWLGERLATISLQGGRVRTRSLEQLITRPLSSLPTSGGLPP